MAPPALPAGPETDPKLNRLVAAQLCKTKMCAMFARGTCQETQCRFAHSPRELRSPPDLTKTAICRMFARGQCQVASCRFAHGEEELRVTPSVYKTQLCNFFERGHCKKGDRCRHAHGKQELRRFKVGPVPEDLSPLGKGLAPEGSEIVVTPPARVPASRARQGFRSPGGATEMPEPMKVLLPSYAGDELADSVGFGDTIPFETPPVTPRPRTLDLVEAAVSPWHPTVHKNLTWVL